MPGLGRLAICLSDQIKEQGKERYSGTKVSQTCSQELDKFRRDQSGNINLDLPLGKLVHQVPYTVYHLCTDTLLIWGDGGGKVQSTSQLNVVLLMLYLPCILAQVGSRFNHHQCLVPVPTSDSKAKLHSASSCSNVGTVALMYILTLAVNVTRTTGYTLIKLDKRS